MNFPPVVFMFSGQGSQYYQMGRELFESEPTFRRWMLLMDTMMLDLKQRSVVRCLYNEANRKADSFHDILVTHPAIFMVEYALAQTLIEKGITPDYVLGASLGAFAAAATAGCVGFEDSLTTVVKQATIIQKSCQPGGMIAVLADSKLHKEEPLASNSEIAAINFASHFVVAARQESLAVIESYLRGKEVTFQRLPVTYPFHSQWIDEAKSEFMGVLETLCFRPAKMPIACCAETSTFEAISTDHLWEIARKPIRFGSTILHLEERGPLRYVDVGPSGSLATFLKYTLPPHSTSEAFVTLSPFGRDLNNLNAVKMKFSQAGPGK